MKQKQIEEIAIEIQKYVLKQDFTIIFNHELGGKQKQGLATHLYNAGYRKEIQGEVEDLKWQLEREREYIEFLKANIVSGKQEVAREIVQILKDYVKSDDCLTWDLSDKEQNELCKIHNLGVNAVKQSIDIIAMEISHKYIGE